MLDPLLVPEMIKLQFYDSPHTRLRHHVDLVLRGENGDFLLLRRPPPHGFRTLSHRGERFGDVFEFGDWNVRPDFHTTSQLLGKLPAG